MDDDPLLAEAEESYAARRLRRLDRLAEIGMVLAEAVGQRAAALAGDTSDEAAAEVMVLTRRFERVARSVRLTAALQAKLEAAAAKAAPDEASAQALDLQALGPAARAKLMDRLRRTDWFDGPYRSVSRVVKQTIKSEREADRLSEREADDMRSELHQKLLDPYAFADQPVGAVIGLICQDLGLSADWDRWEGEPWAIKERRTQAPGSPYVTPPHCPLPGTSAAGRGIRNPPPRRNGASP